MGKKTTVVFITMIISLYLILIVGKINKLFIQSDNLRIIILIILVLYTFFGIWRQILKPGIARKFLSALLIYVLLLFIHIIIDNSYSAQEMLNYLFMPLTFIASLCVYNRVNDKNKLNAVTRIQYLSLITFFIIYVYGRIVCGISSGTIINTAYYQVTLLPFILYIRKPVFKNIGILLILFTTLFSMKRAALLAIIAAIAVVLYIESDNYGKRKNSIKIIGKIVVVIVIFFVLNGLIQHNYGFSMVNKIIDLTNDGGSGRINLLSAYINNISNNSFLEHLLGNGLENSSEIIGEHSIHNDFLEVYYRLGLIGLLIYLNIYRLLLKCAQKIKNTILELYPTFLASIIMFTIISSSSMLIFVPSYIVSFCVFWSFCIARVGLIKKDNEKLESSNKQIL